MIKIEINMKTTATTNTWGKEAITHYDINKDNAQTYHNNIISNMALYPRPPNH